MIILNHYKDIILYLILKYEYFTKLCKIQKLVLRKYVKLNVFSNTIVFFLFSAQTSNLSRSRIKIILNKPYPHGV